MGFYVLHARMSLHCLCATVVIFIYVIYILFEIIFLACALPISISICRFVSKICGYLYRAVQTTNFYILLYTDDIYTHIITYIMCVPPIYYVYFKKTVNYITKIASCGLLFSRQTSSYKQ